MGVDMDQLVVPDVSAIAKGHDHAEIVKLAQLVLGCLLKNENNQYYIANIMQLGATSQQALMTVISDVSPFPMRRTHRSRRPRSLTLTPVGPPARPPGPGRKTRPQIIQLIDEHAPAPTQRRLSSLGFKCGPCARARPPLAARHAMAQPASEPASTRCRIPPLSASVSATWRHSRRSAMRSRPRSASSSSASSN